MTLFGRTAMAVLVSGAVVGCRGVPATVAQDRFAEESDRAPRLAAVRPVVPEAPSALAALDAEGPAAPHPLIGQAGERNRRLLQRQIEPVGQRLAQSASETKIAFRFQTILNPRPASYHTPGGVISVTTGMLEKLNGTDELAAVLALEMAECAAEEAPSASTPGLPGTGPDDFARELALAGKTHRPFVQRAAVLERAGVWLARADYHVADLVRLDDRLAELGNATQPATLRLSDVRDNLIR